MGPVYRGADTETGELVALKALNPELVADQPILLEWFRREGEVLRELDHPNIVRYLAAVEQDSVHYLIMEFVEGGSLRDLLDEQPMLPIERVLEIGLDLADALTRTHRLGIIHRDLKPENVLLTTDGTVRLSDFGVAHIVRRTTLSKEGAFVGTWVYIPPESLQGVEADERADIWGFGILLFEMLAGQVPFEAETPAQLINALMSAPIPDLRELTPGLPADMYDLIDLMLSKEREARIPSVRMVGAALEAINRGQSANLSVAGLTPEPQSPSIAVPRQSTPFIGRRREQAELIELLQEPDYRLVTLTGAGGVGKTRLALQVAEEMRDLYEDGLFFIDFSSISESEHVPSRIARVLGIKESLTRPLVEDIKEQLRSKRSLLILDNFEQILDAGPLVAELILAAPTLKVLVTSREALHLYGEREYPVPPFSLPDLERHESTSDLSEYESVDLFIKRAQAHRPEFRLTEENSRDVAEICVYLDGLPLAIELAAARIRMFSPEYLLFLLSDSLETLTSGPRDVAARHQTLRAAIDWSYQLLDDGEKKLFARSAVFQGGMNLEAVEYVCGQDLDIRVLSALESLLNKNLLQRKDGAAGEPRFIPLVTIHQFVRERLVENNEWEDMQQRHAEYFAQFAERAEPELRGPEQEYWSTRLRMESDNLRAALDWSHGGGHVKVGARLVGALAEFWYYEGPISEGEFWIAQTIKRIEEVPEDMRAKVFNGAGMLAFARGDSANGARWNREALAIARQLSDRSSWAWALFWLSAHATTDPDEYKNGIALCEEALTLFNEINDRPGLAWGNNQIGELSRLMGDYVRARKAYETSLDICRETKNRRREAIALINLTYVAQHMEDYPQAETYALDGLALLYDLDLKYHTAIALSMLALPVAAQGNAMRGARLLGASEAIIDRMSARLQPADQIEVDRYASMLREQLSPEEFEAAWVEGNEMSFDEAVAFALEAKS